MPTMTVTQDESIAIKQQTTIGWRQLFNGCIFKKRLQIQDAYLYDIKLHTHCLNGATWAKQ
eukprot:13681724-Ditylum_brightwellii.AAC.1